MRATDQTLRYLATRVGTGNHGAFRCHYATLAPATLARVRHDLPDPIHSMHVCSRHLLRGVVDVRVRHAARHP